MKFKDFIAQSELSDDNKEMWYTVIDTANRELIRSLAQYLIDTPDDLSKVTENIKQKYKAIRTGDLTLIDQIIKQEHI